MKNICLLLIFVQITHYGTAQGGRVTLKAEPPSVLEGNILTLICRYNYYYWWHKDKAIKFYKDNSRIYEMKAKNSEARHTIKVTSSEYSGEYYCTLDGEKSPRVPVHVSELFSKPTLRAEPEAQIFEGQRLKFICSVETFITNSHLMYSFLKNGHALNLNTELNNYIMDTARPDDSGTYLCKATNFNSEVTKYSNAVSVLVKQLFSKPTLRAEPEAQIFEAQRLKFICSVETFVSNPHLCYFFFKNGHALNLNTELNSYIMDTARPDDSGTYLCKATTFNSEVTKDSNEVSVLVKRVPVSKPELTISPGKEAIAGDTAALTCSVYNGSAPINYIFYKDSNKELHLEQSDLNEITFEIVKVNKSTEGNYSCGVSNQVTGPTLHSEFVAVSVVVPVAGAFLTSNTNQTEISAGFRLVLRCLVTEGTEPRFHWYLNGRQLENISESYHFNADGSELIINSFEISHGGRYHCVAANRGKDVGIFNTTSNHIDVTVPVQSHTTAITASVLPLFLIAVLIALVFFKLRNKKQKNSSSVSRPQGEGTGIGAQSLSEETPAANSEYAVVGSARNTAPDADQLTYCVVQGTKPREDYTKPAADVVYSVVMMKKSRDAGKDDGGSGGKQKNKTDPGDYSITYATLNHTNTEVSLEGDQREEEDDCDANIYENLAGR
ncbi:Fc receptor-like protein 5 [Heptranchias perlo]|uniref:Fc receptor-like protein 5 n=1 Tax=Heptranchias perlo TaxID=212740 RepID=UPI0035596ED8